MHFLGQQVSGCIVDGNGRGYQQDTGAQVILSSFGGLFDPTGMLEGPQEPVDRCLVEPQGFADFRQAQGFSALGRIELQDPGGMEDGMDQRCGFCHDTISFRCFALIIRRSGKTVKRYYFNIVYELQNSVQFR